MRIIDTLQEIQQKYPVRDPATAGSKEVIAAIKDHMTPLGLETQTQKIPVYNFQVSLLIYIIGSLILICLSFFKPLAGFIIGVLFYLLFVSELTRPIFAAARTVPGENLLVTVPARSKEIQKIVIDTAINSGAFIQPPPKIAGRVYLVVVYLLGLGITAVLGLNLIFQQKLLLFLPFIFVLGLVYLKLFAQRPAQSSSLNNCAILMELAQMLAKDRPLRTTVSFLFHASNSMNSGVLRVPKMFDPKLSFSYVIDVSDLPDKRIDIITADGAFIPMKSDPLLVELLMEVARAKNIPAQEMKTGQITAAYTLKFKKISTVSITNPVHEYIQPDSNKDVRELIMGLIRKLDSQ